MYRLRSTCIATVVLIAALMPAASALGDTFHVPGDYGTNQEAIDASDVSGDEIMLGPGTYLEAIDFLGKAIHLHSSHGPGVTTIDAGGLSSVGTSANGEGQDSLQTIWHVDDDNCPGPGSGSEIDPFCRIQDGITAASDTDTVLVASGTYVERISLDGKAITLVSSDGPEVTIISGNGEGPVVWCANSEGPDTILDGFTITGGNWFRGAGMFSYSSPSVRNCTFVGNSASDEGGAIYSNSGMPTVTNCMFAENSAGEAGGAIYSFNSNLVLLNCRFANNVSDFLGGGVYTKSSTSTAINCIFTANIAGGSGAGWYIDHGSSNFLNCTFSRNSAAFFGGGILKAFTVHPPHVTNCVLWENSDNGWIDGTSQVSGNVLINYSCIQGGWSGAGGIGIIDEDPLFRYSESEDANLRLLPGSPCIDAGDNMAVPPEITTDLDGNPRFVDDPDTPDSGSGTPPIVDMGAHEFQPADFCIDDDGDGKVTICHKGHVISVSVHAVPAHLAHGDGCGGCESRPLLGELLGLARGLS